MLRQVLQRTWRHVVRLRGFFPLTNLGVILAGLASLAYWGFGVPRSDYVIQLVAALSLVLGGLALLAVAPVAIASARAYRQAASGARVTFEARRGFATMLRMPSFSWMPMAEIRWTWESPVGFEVKTERNGGMLTEVVEAYERGRSDEIVRRFVIEDAFGLARLSFTRSEKREVEALPWAGLLERAPLLRANLLGDDHAHPLGEPAGDRVDMRHYTPGDPLRLVLWKIYARSGDLMVRKRERAIAPSLRIVAYLCAAEADEPAAAAARIAAESHLFGEGWLFGADGSTRAAGDPTGALDLIVASKSARGTEDGDGSGLASFYDQHGEHGRTRLVLFVPAVPGPWLDRCVDVLHSQQVACTAIVATDGVEDAPDKGEPGWQRWLRRPAEPGPGEARTTVEQIQHVTKTLTAAGAQVVGVERPTGRTLHMQGVGGLRMVA